MGGHTRVDGGTDAEHIPENTDNQESGSMPLGAGRPKLPASLTGALAFVVLPLFCLGLALLAGYTRWTTSSGDDLKRAAAESVQAAEDAAVAMMSYRPDTVGVDLDAAKERLTGPFKDSFSDLADNVVVPAAIRKLITAVATVPAAAAVSATASHSVVLIFVNQSVTVGDSAPRDTNSSVRVSLDRVDGRWLVSGFDPI